MVPIDFSPDAPDDLRELEAMNNLPDGSIKRAQYIKPIQFRAPNQRFANVMLSLTEPEIANKCILDGVHVCGKWSKAWRQKHEPIRCAKCQKYNHVAKVCRQGWDTCGVCGKEHKTRECDRKGGRFCVSCNTDRHCSRDRDCPSFLQRCVEYDERHPENCRVYFPTNESWTLKGMVAPGAPFETYQAHLMDRPASSITTRPLPLLSQQTVIPARSAGSQRRRREMANEELRRTLEESEPGEGPNE
ncbi:unnamed protein product [Peniophora sp. CBMAI 1063]|nr:unnamed protein product [Peniophora sp. CBMAI 1063]